MAYERCRGCVLGTCAVVHQLCPGADALRWQAHAGIFWSGAHVRIVQRTVAGSSTRGHSCLSVVALQTHLPKPRPRGELAGKRLYRRQDRHHSKV